MSFTWRDIFFRFVSVVLVPMENTLADVAARPSVHNCPGLQEPAKHLVLSYKPGDTIPRESYIVGLEGNKSFEYVVSITNNHVVSRTHVNGQAGITSDECV
jgi:Cu2+-containing amine oxidase